MHRHHVLLASALFVLPASAQFDERWVVFEEAPEALRPLPTLVSNATTSLPGDLFGQPGIETDLAWDDLDRDGWTDVVVARKQPFTSLGKRTNMLLMNERGVLVDRTLSFASASDVPGDQGFLTPTNDRDVVVIDVNGDDWPDVVTCTTVSSLADGKAVSHPRVYVNLGQDGSGSWLGLRYEEARVPQFLHFGTGLPQDPRNLTVAAGDVTGDGAPELYFADSDSIGPGGAELPSEDLDDRLLVNDGNGYFTDGTQAAFEPAWVDSGFGTAVVIRDMNLDGAADVIKTTSLTAPQHTALITNDPKEPGRFIDFDPFHAFAGYYVNSGDLNNDGRPDVVVTDDGADRIRYNLATDPAGGVQWGPAMTFDFLAGGDDGFGSNNLVVDLDGDGWQDVVVADVDVDIASYNRRMHVYHNPGGLPGDLIQLREERETASDEGWIGVVGMSGDDLVGTHDVAAFDIDRDTDVDMLLSRGAGTHVWANQTAATQQWTNHGQPLAGAAGRLPFQLGLGPLEPGTSLTLALADAAPGAMAFWVWSLGVVNAPFKGGVLVPDPAQGFVSPLLTDGAGAITLQLVMPAGAPSGLVFHSQWWIEDSGGVFGFAASNAVSGSVP